MALADQTERDDLAGDELPGIDRRDPEQLDDAAHPLPDERQGDERDREVLEHQSQDGWGEVRGHTRLPMGPR